MVKIGDKIIFLEDMSEKKGIVLEIMRIPSNGAPFDFDTPRSEEYLASCKMPIDSETYWSFSLPPPPWWKFAAEVDPKWGEALGFMKGSDGKYYA